MIKYDIFYCRNTILDLGGLRSKMQVGLTWKSFPIQVQRFLPFDNISVSAQDMISQSSAMHAKMRDFPIHPYIKNYAQNEH